MISTTERHIHINIVSLPLSCILYLCYSTRFTHFVRSFNKLDTLWAGWNDCYVQVSRKEIVLTFSSAWILRTKCGFSVSWLIEWSQGVFKGYTIPIIWVKIIDKFYYLLLAYFVFELLNKIRNNYYYRSGPLVIPFAVYYPERK